MKQYLIKVINPGMQSWRLYQVAANDLYVALHLIEEFRDEEFPEKKGETLHGMKIEIRTTPANAICLRIETGGW